MFVFVSKILFNPNKKFKKVDFPEIILTIIGTANLFIFYLIYFFSKSSCNF